MKSAKTLLIITLIVAAASVAATVYFATRKKKDDEATPVAEPKTLIINPNDPLDLDEDEE